MKAFLRNHRQSPRKVRLVADLIKGKTVSSAYVLLAHTPKRATLEIKKVLDSAVANATQNDGAKKEELIVKSVRIDEGATLNRFRPVSRGRAHPIKKRTSHIMVELSKKINLNKKSSKKAVTKTKKVAAKK